MSQSLLHLVLYLTAVIAGGVTARMMTHWRGRQTARVDRTKARKLFSHVFGGASVLVIGAFIVYNLLAFARIVPQLPFTQATTIVFLLGGFVLSYYVERELIERRCLSRREVALAVMLFVVSQIVLLL